MNVVITGGGTGGHIYPALSIAKTLKKRGGDINIIYIGTTNRMEKDIVPSKGFEYFGIEMQGFNRKNIFKNFKLIFLLLKNYFVLRKLYKKFAPDIVIGTGGYVTVPVVYTAAKMNIPTLIFDADYNFGVATRKLLKYVDVVCTSYEKNTLVQDNIIYTGNPSGQIMYETVKRDNVKNKVLFIFGSLGSETLNEFFKEYFNNHQLDAEVKYVTGSAHYETFMDGLTNEKISVVDYLDPVSTELADVKYIVCRSGASFISEINALKIPAIYIPSPYVANDEQVLNARDLIEANCGIMIKENDLSVESFNQALQTMDENYKVFVDNLNDKRKIDSLDLIIEKIEGLVGDTNG